MKVFVTERREKNNSIPRHMIKADKSANDLWNCYLVGSNPTVSIFPCHQLSSTQLNQSFRLSVKPKIKPLNALLLWFMTMKNESFWLLGNAFVFEWLWMVEQWTMYFVQYFANRWMAQIVIGDMKYRYYIHMDACMLYVHCTYVRGPGNKRKKL